MSKISFVGPVAWIRFLSKMAVSESSLKREAAIAASQSWPSASSPSPITTYTRAGLFLSRSDSAIPVAIESPCPSEPVTASIPGVIMSG